MMRMELWWAAPSKQNSDEKFLYEFLVKLRKKYQSYPTGRGMFSYTATDTCSAIHNAILYEQRSRIVALH